MEDTVRYRVSEAYFPIWSYDGAHTTYKYLGINIDDMNDAMKILRDFDKRSSLVIFWLHPKGSTNALPSV